MKTITAGPKQTVYDVAAQYYGTLEAVGEILSLNPEISNATQEDNSPLEAFNLDLPIQPGSLVIIDEESGLINKILLKEINEQITTFEEWHEQ